MGDELIQAILPERSLIIRSSWLHGTYGPNFLETMLRVAKERSEIKVVDDQIGSPTSSYWLAQTIVNLMGKEANGIFNVSSAGSISWRDFAEEVFRQANYDVRVLSQTTQELARPAKRPPYSVLDKSKLESFLGESCIDWKEDIHIHLEQLKK
jgi:dTDP-4-dehydrorhamnose reductase